MNNLSISLVPNNGVASVRVTINGLAATIDAKGMKSYPRISLTAGSIPEKEWDAKKERPKASFSRTDGGNLHRAIDTVYAMAARAYIEAENKTAEAVKTRFNELSGKGQVVVKRNPSLLSSIVEGWIASDEVKDGTKATYRVFMDRVAAYERASGKTMDLAKVKQEDLLGLLSYMTKKGFAPNTISGTRKHLNKAVLQVRKEGIQIERVEGFGFKTVKKEVLDWADLGKLNAYEPATRSELVYKTMAMAFALSSVRISDIYQFLHPDNIKVRGGILCSEFVVTKAPHPTVCPIVFEPVRKLLEELGEPVPHRSEQLLRRGIAKLLINAGITKKLEIHSIGRRSFVSNFLALGVLPDHLLARVFTGHSMSTERGIFHAYNHATMGVALRSVVTLLGMVPKEQTGGLELLSDRVCS